MNKIFNLLPDFLGWLILIIKKWVWLIGLPLPLINLLSTYVPNFPQITIPWLVSVAAGACGFFLSAFLVYRDQKMKLDRFLKNAPQYTFLITDLSQKVCESDKIHIECKVRIRCETIWIGKLDNIALESKKLPEFLEIGEITRKSYQALDWLWGNPLNFPYKIPQNGVDIDLEIHYPYKEDKLLEPKKIAKHAKVVLCLLIGFNNPETVYVQKPERIELPMNMNNFPELIKQHQEKMRLKEI